MIVGKFMSGKTTLINAILGEEVCPLSYEFSRKGITTKVEYGINKSAKIIFRNPMPLKLSQYINKYIKLHIEDHCYKNVPFKNIEIAKIEEYLRYDSDSFDLEEILMNNPFECVEIQYPADILKDGIELFDAFSFNSCNFNVKRLLDLLHTADSVVFMLDTTCPCSKIDMELIEEWLIPMGFKDIIFVANRLDLIKHKDKEEVKKFINKKLSMFTKHEISYISALLALAGKKGYDISGEKLSEEEREKALEKSGFIHFEELLKNYVAEQQKKKLINQIKELRSIIKNNILFKELPNLENQRGKINDCLIIKCKDNLYGISHRLDEIIVDFIEGK